MPALPQRKLGKTNMEVTQLGYGSMGLRGPATWGVRVVEDEAADENGEEEDEYEEHEKEERV